MGRFVAIGGGTFEETDALNRRIAALSGKEIPNVLFIGTALQDSTNPLTSCKKSFKRVCPGCIVKKLSIIRSSYTEEEIDGLLDWADVIYVGGGNTAYLLKEWEKIGLDRKLLKVFKEDTAVISGISAGAVCWFTDVFTDSAMFENKEEWEYDWLNGGLGLYPMAICPHYNNVERAGFDQALNEKQMPAIALSDCTAFVDDQGVYSFIRSDVNQNAYVFSFENGRMIKTPVDFTDL